MTIAYVAQTRDHLLMLDAEGVCLHVHRRHSDLGQLAAAGGRDKSSEGATRCVGAQYVAALDAETEGFLVADPKLGVPMLFAKADAAGRISVIRTGKLERFEVRGSGLYDRPTQRDVLGDTHPTPSIRYMPDVDDEDEPTLRFHPAKVASHEFQSGSTVRLPTVPRPPSLRAPAPAAMGPEGRTTPPFLLSRVRERSPRVA